ncbi:MULTISPECIES: hypothetical protein [unclassified Bradyrhizobium]|uniref:hypothetical protein n=1 Tax=unclassified Bradyrhizobium TaxID=2631580 RepID=UPI001BAA1931|nr:MULTISPECIES: hypothetical protein [unclassified Bradyrhizobium]MBR1203627.1 hypothetical protein [Bradyrhizobium sp. AUGA SZCCT0124]MBR1313290.1 hypothetical protein [Bradyrhizobium sp. AUGA SZCCT0051]MBR1341648.1 hypothetical protein [Bradyrhizobium sp. AUGA SZCCT0105]MBR1356414.1 hypothetical protein [Bradyrhizobium sp. AUGA SZCCT0045]
MFCVVAARSAEAHVKWFCAYDVAGQPRGLENVLCLDFELLLGVAVFWLFAGCLIEPTSLGDATIRVLDRITEALRLHTELMMRAVCAFFFISIWAVGGILLTPELKTSSPLVGALQLAIAAGMLSRRTLPLSAVGMAILFGIGVRGYGVFHLADYPIFLGVAAYFALIGLNKDLFGIRPIDVMRYAAAVTLMWASIEKWAYPEWSFPLLIEHAGMTLGFDNEFYMRAAGMVEFTLAFALIWTPLIRRCAAAVLVGMFISACFEFGKIDTIGHSAIIAVLFAILADNKVLPRDRRAPWLAPVALCAALSLTLFVYYFGHAAIFKTSVL